MNSLVQLDTQFFRYNDANAVNNYSRAYTSPDLQVSRRPEYYSNTNNYIKMASDALNMQPTVLFSVFFSDDNIKHLRAKVVEHVRDATARSNIFQSPEGVTVQEPNIDNFFTYMLRTYMNYNTLNGSICFVNVEPPLKESIAKLNSSLLQEYVSKLVSEMAMYLQYYNDASALPEQLASPQYTRMKGSRSLEYNTAFVSGNSEAVSAFNQIGNIPIRF